MPDQIATLANKTLEPASAAAAFAAQGPRRRIDFPSIMSEAQEKLLAEIRDLLANAVAHERARSDARDALIAASLEMQRRAVAMQRRTVIGGAVVVLVLLVVLVCAFVLEHR